MKLNAELSSIAPMAFSALGLMEGEAKAVEAVTRNNCTGKDMSTPQLCLGQISMVFEGNI